MGENDQSQGEKKVTRMAESPPYRVSDQPMHDNSNSAQGDTRHYIGHRPMAQMWPVRQVMRGCFSQEGP